MTSGDDACKALLLALDRMNLEAEPWRWGYDPQMLVPAQARILAKQFPAGLLHTASAKERSEKRYSMRTALLETSAQVSETWGEFLSCLRSETYRARLQHASNRSLADCDLEISLWEYGPADLLDPHVDKPDKVVTQIFYLSSVWKADWGGRLMIKAAKDATPSFALLPILGSSAVIVRSDDSWHAVEPVAAGVSQVRRSVTAMFRRRSQSHQGPTQE